MDVELTTVADDLAVIHRATTADHYVDLTPETQYEFDGLVVRTLPRPPGALLARVATVNDVHFGETECGRVDDYEIGPIIGVEPGETPYPVVMNHAAVAEIAAADVDAVIVKGDLTTAGSEVEFGAFDECYLDAFGERLHVVRGNHDAYQGQRRHAGDQWIDLPGLSIALVDTVVPTQTGGTLRAEQLTWLDDTIADRHGRVMLMGHHQQWVAGVGDDGHRSDDYFGLEPDASDGLDAVCARRANVIAYTAGHTHRHRVRSMNVSGVPTIEVGCVKDFPGTWAEYRVFEGGVMQVVHRISSPEALEWSERCRHLYADFGIDYEAYALGSLGDRCFVIDDRP